MSENNQKNNKQTDGLRESCNCASNVLKMDDLYRDLEKELEEVQSGSMPVSSLELNLNNLGDWLVKEDPLIDCGIAMVIFTDQLPRQLELLLEGDYRHLRTAFKQTRKLLRQLLDECKTGYGIIETKPKRKAFHISESGTITEERETEEE